MFLKTQDICYSTNMFCTSGFPKGFQNGNVPTTLAVVQVSTQASEASGIASKAQVKLFALEATTAAPAILEIHGPLDRAAAACYFVQMQLWLEGALGVPSKER